MNLVTSKSLENLESLGGVQGLLHGLGTDRLRGLSMLLGRSQRGPPDPAIINAVAPYGVSILPTGVPVFEGLQSAARLGGSGVKRSPSSKISSPYEATIEDRQRIYGHNILARRPTNGVLVLTCLALHDKVIVSTKKSYSFP